MAWDCLLRCERPKRGRPEGDSPTRPCGARGWRVGLAPVPPAPGAYSRLHPHIRTLREVTGKSRPGTDRLTGEQKCQLHTPSPPLLADLLSSAAAAYPIWLSLCNLSVTAVSDREHTPLISTLMRTSFTQFSV